MKLREHRVRGRSFAIAVVLIAIFGMLVANYSFLLGGNWRLLGYSALLGELLLVYGVFIEPTRLTVARYREPLVKHPSVWVRVAFICDLHTGGGFAEDWWERVVLETQALAPDLIILGGDYVVDMVDTLPEMKQLSKLRAPLGKFFVLGNHDYLDRPQEVRVALKNFGYEDLSNRSVLLKHESRELEVSGLDDLWYGPIKPFTRRSPLVPSLLVSHEPDAILDLKAGDTDLVISGHTHGGQVRFPIVGSAWVPSKLGRSFYRGRKIINGVAMIISNGLGQPKTQPRLFSPPQIVVVEVGI